MGRWRPPREKSSPYITPQGAERLAAELKQLWKVERPKVTEAVHEAAKNGDRSENGDYIYGKRRLREIDSRVRFLTKRLDQLTVDDNVPSDQTKVYFGAWVTLIDEAGEAVVYQIVGPDEFEVEAGKISMDSPLAKKVLKRQLDDEIIVDLPAGKKTYWIDAINYGEKPSQIEDT